MVQSEPASTHEAISAAHRGGSLLAVGAVLAFVVPLMLATIRLWVPGFLFSSIFLPELLLVVSTATVTVAVWMRTVPLQSVLLAVAVTVSVAFAAVLLGLGAISVPQRSLSAPLQRHVLWIVPVLWASLLLLARGTARWLLSPWRKRQNHGLKVIALTLVLALAMQVKVELYARAASQVFPSGGAGSAINLGGALLSACGWAIAVLIASVLTTPALTNKSPVAPPPSFGHMGMWLGLEGLFLTAAAQGRQWGPGVAVLIESLALGALVAWRQKVSNARH